VPDGMGDIDWALERGALCKGSGGVTDPDISQRPGHERAIQSTVMCFFVTPPCLRLEKRQDIERALDESNSKSQLEQSRVRL
jgi:hypothetical protein